MLAKADPQLGRRCLAYNAQVLLGRKTRLGFAQLQDRIMARVKCPLWRCPPETLHVSITPFLSVRSEYGGRKEALWKENREHWIQALRASVRQIRNWTVRFESVRVTDTAIVAVADDGGMTNLIRRELDLPESKGWDLVHTTLFRFASAYEITASDCQKIGGGFVNIAEAVTEIVIAKEQVYPSIDLEVIERFAIGTVNK